jgi:nitroreductase
LSRLKELIGPADSVKLDRAPTLIVASCVSSDDPVQNEEDSYATAAAVYAVLLGAHALNLASYWRTPAFLREAAAGDILGLAPSERVIGLIHLGPKVNDPPSREVERARLHDYVTFLA